MKIMTKKINFKITIEETAERHPVPVLGTDYKVKIIYKNINNEYTIINSNASAYNQIYSELYNRITNTIDGKAYSEYEISQMQNKGSFIEFDYDRKSKNYVFMLEEKEIGIIKRFSDSGQVIQNSLSNKDKLIEKIDAVTKGIFPKYDFDTEYNYNSENSLSKVEANLNLPQTKIQIQKMLCKNI